MLFPQLKTLIWRNAVLKKRGYITTALEIIIPTLIIYIIAKSSYKYESDESFHGLENYPKYIVNNSTRITNMDIRNRYYISFSNDFDTQKKNLFIENFKKNEYFSSFKYIEPNVNYTKHIKSEYYIENGELVTFDEYVSDEKYIKFLTNNNTANNNTSSNKGTLNNTNNTPINNKTANNTMNNTPMNNTPMNNTPMNNKPTDNVTTGGVPTTLDNNGNTVNDKSAKSKCQQEYKILIFDNEKDAMNAYRNDILKQEKEMRKIYLSQQDDIEQQGDIDQQEDDYISIEDFIISFKSLTEFTLYSKYYLYQDELIDELVTKVENIYSIYDDDKLAFTNLQILTSNALMKTLKGNVNMNTIPEIEFNYKVMDKPKYNKKVEEDAAQDTVPLFMLFYFVPCICSLLSNLVIEKESKIKESLVIVGMKKSMFWLSWAITYGIIIVIASFIASYVINYLKIFVSIHWLILFVTFTIYGLSCICISFALSTLINKSKTSNTIGALVILTYFALYFFNIFVKNETARWIACFALPPVSFLSLMEYLIKLENQKLPTTFLTMLDNSLLRNYFFSIIGSLFIYFFLALYLDNVLPQGSNLHKKWHFFITDLLRCCRSKNRRNNDDGYYYNNHTQANQNNPFIQKDPEGLRKSVEVRHIGRNFKAKEGKLEILKDINFNAYYDEIFAILGHNGAGKTTLLRIMTGVLSSSRGEVYYDNIPIRGNETDVCKQFGYCPQFDTFSKNLTVEEHVKLFAGIKGIKVDVDEVLKDIDLLNKKKNFPKQLSGGQRRKLCITLALLGSPNYVFLDEPTTGLDPYSRKNIWELLSRKKKGCTMFVTTHYMDEADLLADRKMIISNGNITCLGTSIFLKKTFNMNYSLDITLGREKDIYYIDPLIDYYCPGATNTKVINASQYEVIDNNHINHNNSTGNRNNRRRPNNNNNNNNNRNNNKFIVTYLLPMDHVNHFKDIFKALNDLINRNNNSISNFSITAPTLEELFIKLERNKMENQMDRDIQKVKNVATVDMNSYDDGDTKRLINNLNPVFGKTNINKSSAFRQIYSIVKIRLKIFLRNKTFAFIYTLFPICLIVACIYFENKFIDSSYDSNETYKPLEMKPTLYNKVTWFKDTKASNGIALDIINKVNIGNNPYEEVDYENQLTIKSNQLNPDQSKIYIGGFSGVVNNNNNNNNINNNINNNNLLNNNNRQVLDFTIYHDICYTFSIPIGINYIYNTILEHYNINKQFLVTYNPLPRYYLEDYDENDKEGIINKGPELTRLSMESILSLAMALAISLSISTFGPLTVKEREEGITWQLFLNGTSRMNYWIGVLISDTICIFVPTLLIVLAGYFNEISIFGMNVIAFSVTVTLLWIMGSLVHQYVVSHFFKRYDKCSNLFIILNPILTLFAGIYCLVAVINQEEVDETERAKAEMNESSNAKILRYIFYVILVLYVPSTIVYYYTKISGFVGRYKLNISEDKYLSFSQSKLYQDIANNANLSKVEKSKQAAKAFFKLNSPTFNDFIKSKDAKYCAIIVLGLILLYVIILYIRIRSQTKSLKSHKKYTKNEIKIKNKKLMDGPSDVYNEFKRVQQKINENDKTKVNVNVTINNDNNNYNNYDNHYYNYNNDNNNNNNYNNNYNNNNNSSSNNNNISMMSYRLNKDYSITLSEMQKKKREKAKEDKIEDKYENKKSKQNDFINEEGKDKNRNKNDSIKESAFTKMDDRITYDKTKKIYTNRIVDDVTFGVDAGQCLGLLGPNGAGKTTSIYMMTGLVPRTHGRVVYGNNDLDNTDLSGLSLGYCAQHDSLWKLLTVKETIQFYLNICGYPHKDIPYYTKSLIEACGIENHTNKKVSEISGGTKRKLSLIIAICSSPSYLILDEPSAGMDPFTRRYMWRLISQLKKVRETSTILTTHSTEEAEALCDRIAILIKGNLVCIDTPNSIKMNQSNRYVLEVFTDHPQEFEEVYIMRYNLFGLDQTISEKQYNVESSFNHQKYTVEMKTQNIANVFSVMEMAKRRGHISQYNFGQYSLEQIFIDFVNNTK